MGLKEVSNTLPKYYWLVEYFSAGTNEEYWAEIILKASL
jgi:hypothetical protein